MWLTCKTAEEAGKCREDDEHPLTSSRSPSYRQVRATIGCIGFVAWLFVAVLNVVSLYSKKG